MTTMYIILILIFSLEHAYAQIIEPELGFSLASYKKIHTGISQVSVIFQLERLENITIARYNKPCEYEHALLLCTMHKISIFETNPRNFTIGS